MVKLCLKILFWGKLGVPSNWKLFHPWGTNTTKISESRTHKILDDALLVSRNVDKVSNNVAGENKEGEEGAQGVMTYSVKSSLVIKAECQEAFDAILGYVDKNVLKYMELLIHTRKLAYKLPEENYLWEHFPDSKLLGVIFFWNDVRKDSILTWSAKSLPSTITVPELILSLSYIYFVWLDKSSAKSLHVFIPFHGKVIHS